MPVEHLRDERVDVEMRRARPTARLDPGAEHDLEVVQPRRDHRGQHERDACERQQQLAGQQPSPIRDAEDERADAEPEQAAARERRQLDEEEEGEDERERQAQPVPRLEPQVKRREDEQRDDEHDPEVVRVAGERVRAVDVGAGNRAVDVDRARAAGDGREQPLVEIAPGARDEQLDDPVRRVRDEPGDKPPERAPVVALAPPREERDRRREEHEVDDELDHPLRELVERVGRVEVEEADEVDEQERRQKREHDGGRARPASRHARSEGEQEADREHVGDADRPGDVPVELLERHAEDRGEKQAALQARHAGSRLHRSLARSSARA